MAYLPLGASLVTVVVLMSSAYAARHLLARHWRAVIPRLPLPTLALAASYGVYSFSALFVPMWVAIIQAAAFELTYIGMAATLDLSHAQRRRAGLVSVAAVVVSVIYNTLAGWFHRQPQLLDTAAPLPWLMLAILHGAPLAWVAYYVAQLLLHAEPRPSNAGTRGRRRLVRALCAALRTSRAHVAQLTQTVAQGDARVAQLTQEDARIQAEVAQGDARVAQLTAQLAQEDARVAQLTTQLAQEDARVAQLTTQLAQEDARVAQLTTQLAQAIARTQVEVAQATAEVAQQVREREAQMRAACAETEQARAAAARAEAERAHWATEAAQVGDLDMRGLAQWAASLGAEGREIARRLGRSESTVRGWLKPSRGVSAAD